MEKKKQLNAINMQMWTLDIHTSTLEKFKVYEKLLTRKPSANDCVDRLMSTVQFSCNR